MENKGFTLIELLAVIVILAIIALIATPIVLNIISDARDSSDEKSVELYGAAVEQAIMRAQMKGIPISRNYTSSDDGKTLTPFDSTDNSRNLNVDYSGSQVNCSIVVVNTNGEIYLSQCSVNGVKTNKKYGKYQQVFKPQYYSWSTGNIDEGLPNDADSNLSNIDTNDHSFYLGFDSAYGETIYASYVCFERNGNEYCLKSGDNVAAVETNKNILDDAFYACTLVDNYYNCSTGDFVARVYSDGSVSARDDRAMCEVYYSNRKFDCKVD